LVRVKKFPMKIYLAARQNDAELISAWNSYCGDLDFVEVYVGSILDLDVDAVVSPANSFGFMDGGIDYVYTEFFGAGLQDDLQGTILMERMGELLVGEAQAIETFHDQIPYVISAPTMRVPMILGPTSINPYLAARAALREANAYELDSIAFPGLGTGVGQVPPNICAHQVRVAIDEVFSKEIRMPTSWRQAQIAHQKLYLQNPRDLQYHP